VRQVVLDRRSPIVPRHNALPTNVPPRGLSREQAAAFCGIATDLFDRLVKDGTLPRGIKLRGRTVWDRAALDRAFDRLSGLTEPQGEHPSTKTAIMEAIRGAP
jgi:predicted DNA-binding transcriptional regulator AlpA